MPKLLRDCENAEGIAVHVRNSDVVGDHRAVIGNREPAHVHRPRNLLARGPGRSAIGGGGETYVQLARALGAAGIGIVVVNNREVRVGARAGWIDADPGDEVIDGAGGWVDRNTGYRAPDFAVGRSAHHDVVLGTAGAKAAIGPDHKDLAGAVNGGGRQVGIAQSGSVEMAIDVGYQL